MKNVLFKLLKRSLKNVWSKTWVCTSSPLTMLPTVRRAGRTTNGEEWLNNKPLIRLIQLEFYIEDCIYCNVLFLTLNVLQMKKLKYYIYKAA